MSQHPNDSSDYRQDNQEVLHHYFNELLPAAENEGIDTNLPANNTKSESALDEKPSTEVHQNTASEPKTVINQNKNEQIKEPLQEQEIKQAQLDRQNHSPAVDPTPVAIPAAKPVITQPLSSSTPLMPLNDEASVDDKGNAYEAHKERLERMLKQLTPVKPPAVDQQETSTVTPNVIEPVLEETETISPEFNESNVTDTLITETLPLSSEWLENGRPHWAQEPFDILLVDVNGLKLAVPLIALGHIEPIESELTPLFGQAKWFLGLQKTAFGNIKTIDTAEYVMPERAIKDQEHDYQFVVSISGLRWGLAVDSIDQPILIDPENIRWRAKRENRPWMAGTVKDHMCVLLDIPVMGEILQKEDQNHRIPTGE